MCVEEKGTAPVISQRAIHPRGNARDKIFSNDQDREHFLAVLGAVIKRYNWLCYAYCLMDNHYHLMIETSDANLSIGMRQLNGVYTQKYNRRHSKPGHIFQGRFKAILVQKENYLLELCSYVVLNPVRAKIVEKPEAWRWSGYCATAGIIRTPAHLSTGWILGLFSSKRETAQKGYRKFIREGIPRGSPWDELQGQVILGEEGFFEEFKNLLDEKSHVTEIPHPQRHLRRPSLAKIFKEQKTKTQRNENIYHAHVAHGYLLKEIADYLKIHYTTVSKAIAREPEGRK